MKTKTETIIKAVIEQKNQSTIYVYMIQRVYIYQNYRFIVTWYDMITRNSIIVTDNSEQSIRHRWICFYFLVLSNCVCLKMGLKETSKWMCSAIWSVFFRL